MGKSLENIEDAKQVAREYLQTAPKLVPFHDYNYLPTEPDLVGNPMFSVVDSDTVYCGFDFANYLHHAFNIDLPSWAAWEKPNWYIPFWEDIVARNDKRKISTDYAAPKYDAPIDLTETS